MKKHTKTYFEFFDIDYDITTSYYDYSDCEVCGGVCQDVHHIKFKSQGGKDNIENLIGLCRTCHNSAHSGKLLQVDLQTIHNLKMAEYKY